MLSEQEGASKSPTSSLSYLAGEETALQWSRLKTSRAELRPLCTARHRVLLSPRRSPSYHAISMPGAAGSRFLSPPFPASRPPGPAYLSSWASQPRAGRRRYLSSSQSPWRPGERSSSRVSYTFLGAEAAGAEPPVSTGSAKLACSRVGSGEGGSSLPSQPDRTSQNCGEVMSLSRMRSGVPGWASGTLSSPR